MKIYYFRDKEQMLRTVKSVTRQGGCYCTGFTLPNGRHGFEIHRNGKVEAKYLSMKQ